MLKIGEFAILSKISIYMLRNYNEIDLLIPAYTDDFTGYRYYREEHLPVAFSETDKYTALFCELKESEEKAYQS